MKTAFILLATCLVLSQAFYGPETDVVKLTSSNFQSEVVDSDDFWLVEFYAPWCGHCKKLTPEWIRAAKGLKGIVKMGAVDMTTDQEAGKDYDVQGFPTLKWFGEDKANPIEYDGGRTSVGIINYAMKKLKEVANTRIGNTRKNAAKAPKKEKKEEEPKKEEEQQQEEDSGEDHVVVVTEENFEELIGSSQEAWFIEFYAPWCGHCKTLAPIWKKFAAAVKGKINVAKCDATVGKRELSERFNVKGYPSLKWFPSGAKDPEVVQTYEGQRDLESIQRYAEEQQALSKPAELTQIVNQAAFDDRCVGFRGVCVVLFVPNLAESSNEDRVRYLQQYENVANPFRGRPFAFLWSEGGANFDFEQGLNVGGAGYPAVVAISTKKNVYAQLRGSFSESNLKSFVAQVGQGKGGFQKYNVLPAIKEVKAWESPVQKEDL